jgi:hypothetical protein
MLTRLEDDVSIDGRASRLSLDELTEGKEEVGEGRGSGALDSFGGSGTLRL